MPCPEPTPRPAPRSARDPRVDVLFEPLQIGPKTLRNRFYAVPHSTGFGSDRPAAQAAFRSMKAEGGWAAVCVELTSIDPESDRNPVPIPVRLWDDDDVANLRMVCDEIHEHGALAGVELWHGGSGIDLNPGRYVAVGPSSLPNDAYPLTTPKELTVGEIREIQAAYAEAAIRAERAGFDIVYVYGAHGYLPMQFLSSFYNVRADAYGGSLERRARFWAETLEAVRDAVGGSCAIATRLGIDPDGNSGVGPTEAAAFVELVDDLVDVWDVNTSALARPWLDMRPSSLSAAGYQLAHTRAIRDATRKPIVGVSRMTDPLKMAQVVASGIWDLIGGARPSIADPFLPRKIEEGRFDEIRDCIGCNVCLWRAQGTDQIVCTQNATAGEEYRRRWHPERLPSIGRGIDSALVVGGGPAGMECAAVLAQRGVRHVQLVEAEPQLGGHIRWLATLPGLGEWQRVSEYRERLLARLGNVSTDCETTLTPQAILDYEADAVIVATGAEWSRTGVSHLTHAPIPGAQEHPARVVTPEQLASRGDDLGDRVLVYDCEGYQLGVAIARHLALSGHEVELITPHPLVAPYLDRTFEGASLRAEVARCQITTRTETRLDSIDGETCTLRQFGMTKNSDADNVVLVTSRAPRRELHDALVTAAGAPLAVPVFAVGDCVAPRLLADAIFDAHRLAREIDRPLPQRPVPYLRERRTVATERPALVS
jgi:dimethylamine/trimethylamine dehydrogenase